MQKTTDMGGSSCEIKYEIKYEIRKQKFLHATRNRHAKEHTKSTAHMCGLTLVYIYIYIYINSFFWGFFICLGSAGMNFGE